MVYQFTPTLFSMPTLRLILGLHVLIWRYSLTQRSIVLTALKIIRKHFQSISCTTDWLCTCSACADFLPCTRWITSQCSFFLPYAHCAKRFSYILSMARFALDWVNSMHCHLHWKSLTESFFPIFTLSLDENSSRSQHFLKDPKCRQYFLGENGGWN